MQTKHLLQHLKVTDHVEKIKYQFITIKYLASFSKYIVCELKYKYQCKRSVSKITMPRPGDEMYKPISE